MALAYSISATSVEELEYFITTDSFCFDCGNEDIFVAYLVLCKGIHHSAVY